ncbi:hypothetical protein AMECASPLE_037646, partial [Ameca splendens]
MSNPLEGTSYLLFQNIVRNDSGIYQCESGGNVGHNINIIVNGTHVANNSNNSNNSQTLPNGKDKQSDSNAILIYVYSAAGIGAFVIIVIIISVICMQGCKGKSRKEKQTENQ